MHYFAGDAFLKGVFVIRSVKSDAKSDERYAASKKNKTRWSFDNASAKARL
jgi:hypothetical protein